MLKQGETVLKQCENRAKTVWKLVLNSAKQCENCVKAVLKQCVNCVKTGLKVLNRVKTVWKQCANKTALTLTNRVIYNMGQMRNHFDLKPRQLQRTGTRMAQSEHLFYWTKAKHCFYNYVWNSYIYIYVYTCMCLYMNVWKCVNISCDYMHVHRPTHV